MLNYPPNLPSVSTALNSYIDSVIRLSASDIQASASSRNWATSRIQNIFNSNLSYPPLYADKPFLNFGSYFKQTQPSKVEEFDMLMVFDTYGLFYWEAGGTLKGHGKGKLRITGNPLGLSPFLRQYSSNISPMKLIDWTQSVISSALCPSGVTAPVKDGSAITVSIQNSNTKIDFVPALILKPEINSESYFYVIPAGHGKEGWIKTAPHEDMAELDRIALNKSNFKNIIRIVKRLTNAYRLPVKSYAIETCIVRQFQFNPWSSDIYANLISALEVLIIGLDGTWIPDQFGFNILDTTCDYQEAIGIYKGLIARLSQTAAMPMSQEQANQMVRSILENIENKLTRAQFLGL